MIRRTKQRKLNRENRRFIWSEMARLKIRDIEWGRKIDEDKMPGTLDEGTILVLDDINNVIFHVTPSQDLKGGLDYDASTVYGDQFGVGRVREVLGPVKRKVLKQYQENLAERDDAIRGGSPQGG